MNGVQGSSRCSDQLSAISSNTSTSTSSVSSSVSGTTSSSAGSAAAEDGGRVLLPHPFSPFATSTKGSSYAGSTSSGGGGGGEGGYSPHSAVNGTGISSPPALSSPPSGHDPPLPPSGRDTQRQVAKVRRFLTTLQQFASEINADAGERVRGLTLNLMSGLITVEEFHIALQEVTHFPLRPFVLPFLRSHIPLLTRDLRRHATRHGMPVQQYVAVQEAALLEAAAAAASGPEPGSDFFSQDPSSSSSGGGGSTGGVKRRHHSSTFFENAAGATDSTTTSPPPPKRLAGLFSPPFPSLGGCSPDPPTGGSAGGARDGGGATLPHTVNEDEWKNIHMMLNCILSMVEKTRRALTILQQREDGSQAGGTRGGLEGRTLRPGEHDAEVRRHAGELVAQAIRQTEERVQEVKRKAEEAVAEVRRTAVTEVQRAVTAADARAQEVVAAERARLEALLRELGRREAGTGGSLGVTITGTPDHRPDPHQACWNCGRKAHETCSGCNVARYCGPFCQHKDWDGHHKVCSPTLAATTGGGHSVSGGVAMNGTSVGASGGGVGMPSMISSHHNGHHTPKLASVTHKLLAKAADVTKME